MKKYWALAALIAAIALGIGYLLNTPRQCVALSDALYDKDAKVIQIRKQLRHTFEEKLNRNQAPLVHPADTVIGFSLDQARTIQDLKALTTSGIYQIDQSARDAVQEVGPTLTPGQCYSASFHYNPAMVVTEGINRIDSSEPRLSPQAHNNTPEMMEYRRALQEHIEKAWSADGKTVKFILTLQKNGQFKDLILLIPEDKALQQKLTTSIQSLSPFAPLPVTYDQDFYTSIVTLGKGYKLQDEDAERYRSELRNRFARSWNPPPAMAGHQVAVNIVINRLGRIIRTELVQSSGEPSLDELALTTAKALDPLSAIPSYYRPDSLGILWTFEDKPKAPSASHLTYSETLRQHLSGLWKDSGPHVELRLVIQKDGSLKTLSVSKSSGSTAVDNKALLAIRSATPFPPPPNDQPTFTTVYVMGKKDLLDAQEIQRYRQDLKRSIMPQWHPTAETRSKPVKVSFTVDRNGRLLKAEISQSSGDRAADEAALAAIKSAILPSFSQYSDQAAVNISGEFGGGHELKVGSFADYKKQMRKSILQHWHPPEALGNRKVEVSFRLDRRGHISNLKLAKSSGDLPIDQAALAAIREAEPLPELPADYHKEGIDVIWLFDRTSQAVN